jgi:hypothetical protein
MTPGDHEKHATRLAAAGPYTETAQVHATLAVAGQLARLGESIELAARLMAAGDHPPVPEQAATPAQAEWVAENQPLWAGWQPGTWPVHDPVDPRGFRWADPLQEEGT